MFKVTALGPRLFASLALFLALGALAKGLPAAEISVISTGAVGLGLNAAVAAFQKQSGDTVRVTYDAAPQIGKRIEGGEKFDVVITAPSMLDGFAAAGRLGDERVNIGRVGQGVFVRQGTAVPDVSTPDALKRAVLDADSLVFNRATGGMYIESLLKKMGVYDQIEKKTTRYAGSEVFDHVAKGRGKELGFGGLTQIAEFRGKGLQLAGALPSELQNYNPYAAATMRTASNAGAAQTFVRYLASPAAKKLFAEAGID